MFEKITSLINHYPSLKYIFPFLVSFIESLAVIGTFIPGSFTMTIIGMMIGNSYLPYYTTIFILIIGAFIGDLLSYWIGFLFKDRIISFLIKIDKKHIFFYIKNLFSKYGSSGIIIGRFFGPVRSFISLIAGIFSFPKKKFVIFSLISSIFWSIIYIIPGYLLSKYSMKVNINIKYQIFFIAFSFFIFLFLIYKIKKR